MARRKSASPPESAPPPGPAVVLVTALRAEARPLIERFGLSRAGDDAPFARFTGEQDPVELVVCGPGKVSAAAAVAHVGAFVPSVAWLDVGIAGNAHHPLGSVHLAHRVRDDASGRAWFPPLVFRPPCPTAAVTTVAEPCIDYPDDDLYDMEAAGFYEIAARHAPHELVHCIKVVSDNRDHPARLLDGARVTALIGDNLDTICAVIDELAALATEYRRLHDEPPGLDELLGAARFSATRRRQLRRALRRWAVLRGDIDPVDWVRRRDARSAAEILGDIEAHLDSRPAALRAQP